MGNKDALSSMIAGSNTSRENYTHRVLSSDINRFFSKRGISGIESSEERINK